MMKSMHDPNYRENLEDKLKELKEDPELAPIMQEIEQGGPAAMMKCALVPGTPLCDSTRLACLQPIRAGGHKRSLVQSFWHKLVVLADTGTTQRCWRSSARRWATRSTWRR